MFVFTTLRKPVLRGFNKTDIIEANTEGNYEDRID